MVYYADAPDYYRGVGLCPGNALPFLSISHRPLEKKLLMQKGLSVQSMGAPYAFISKRRRGGAYNKARVEFTSFSSFSLLEEIQVLYYSY